MTSDASSSTSSVAADLSPQKQAALFEMYRVSWDEATWRRNAGYRTIILGFGYLAALMAVVAFNRQMTPAVKVCLASVVAVATIFGGAYLCGNYAEYMKALGRMVRVEQFIGAFDPDYL